jgi:DNA repair protein RadC
MRASKWKGAPRSCSTGSVDGLFPTNATARIRGGRAHFFSSSAPLAPLRQGRGLRRAQFSETPMTPQEETVILEARDILGRYLSQNPVIGSWQALMDYCAFSVRGPIERFHALYLDRKNRIIADELLSTGTVDHVPVYPREVIKRALMLNASALILIHNHPSGDPTPSEADLSMTKEIQKGCRYLGLTLYDHIIVGAGTELSLRALGRL